MDLDDEELIATRKLHGQNDGLYEDEISNIEEDVKILKNMIEEYEDCSVPGLDMQVDISFRKKQANALRNILLDYEKNKKKVEEQQERINYLEDNRKQVKEQIQSAEMDLGFAKDMLTDI